MKNNCDSELCIIYQCDEESEWDEEFICHNKCRIHLRCEGRILEDKCLPENYECEKCQTGVSNKYWLEEKIIERKTFLESKVQKFKKEHNDIAVYIERIEEDESKIGPRQRKLKNACKLLGLNPACYHGGDFEGKAIQTMLDTARKPYKFELLECLEDKPEIREKYVRAFSTLAKVSDALKTPMPDYDDEDVEVIKGFCEEWEHNWLSDFLKKPNTKRT